MVPAVPERSAVVWLRYEIHLLYSSVGCVAYVTKNDQFLPKNIDKSARDVGDGKNSFSRLTHLQGKKGKRRTPTAAGIRISPSQEANDTLYFNSNGSVTVELS